MRFSHEFLLECEESFRENNFLEFSMHLTSFALGTFFVVGFSVRGEGVANFNRIIYLILLSLCEFWAFTFISFNFSNNC